MWRSLLRLLRCHSTSARPTVVLEPRPPEVVVDEVGAEVRFNRVPQWRIEWFQVYQVAVDVIDYGGGDAEGFWELSGGPVPFSVPVEIVAGSEAFNARLFALSGFNAAAYKQAREAEASGLAGFFICWHAHEAEPGAAADRVNGSGLPGG